jgi:hypothetical protein
MSDSTWNEGTGGFEDAPLSAKLFMMVLVGIARPRIWVPGVAIGAVVAGQNRRLLGGVIGGVLEATAIYMYETQQEKQKKEEAEN